MAPTPTAQFLADVAYGGLAWWRGDPEYGMRLIYRAASRLEADPHLSSRADRQLDVAAAWCSTGYLDRARPFADRAVELARSEGAVGRLPDALQWAAGLGKETGQWAQALAYGSQALDLALATGQTFLACNALVIIAEIEAAQGRDEDCLQHAREPTGWPAKPASSCCRSAPGLAQRYSHSAAVGWRRRSIATRGCGGSR